MSRVQHNELSEVEPVLLHERQAERLIRLEIVRELQFI